MAASPPPPEAWLRGPVPGVHAFLQPVAHALIQAREDIRRVAQDATPEDLWTRPGGAASAGFHLFHLAGALDRLFTWARGEDLTSEQRMAVTREAQADMHEGNAAGLVERAEETIDRALEQVRRTPPDVLMESRPVGRKQLPSSVAGLLFHGAEHTARHTGQLITTLKVVRGR